MKVEKLNLIDKMTMLYVNTCYKRSYIRIKPKNDKINLQDKICGTNDK